MTKHEGLNLIRHAGNVSAKSLYVDGYGEYQTVYSTVKRMHRAGLLNIYKVGNYRETFYELSNKGLERLKYFNDNDCPNENCSCKE